MQNFLTAIIATVLMSSCQAAKPSDSPERKALVSRLEALEVEVKKEKLNMPMYWTLDKVKNYAIDGGLALKLEALKHYL